ncbi:MAG: DUF2163 domain-containing protein [Terriglobales bacterium]
MKTPINIGGNDLITWLETATVMVLADLFTITLKNGTVLRYTDWETALVVLGVTYNAGFPNFQRGAISETIGFQVGTMELIVSARPGDLLNGSPLLATVGRGDWSGATVQVNRLYMDAALTQIGMFVRFLGRLGALDLVTRTQAKWTVKSLAELLNVKLPIKVIQTGCSHTLFDGGVTVPAGIPGCHLAKASFAVTGSVASGSTAFQVNAGLSQADDYFALGVIAFTSGAGNGQSFSVATYKHGSPSVLTFPVPLPFVPQAGDTFTIYPGCDKTMATCSTKFSNLANFGGEPFIPAPETAL